MKHALVLNTTDIRSMFEVILSTLPYVPKEVYDELIGYVLITYILKEFHKYLDNKDVNIIREYISRAGPLTKKDIINNYREICKLLYSKLEDYVGEDVKTFMNQMERLDIIRILNIETIHNFLKIVAEVRCVVYEHY